MTREEAIALIKQLRSMEGGFSQIQDNYPEVWKGSIARGLWHNNHFEYGMEYGYILGLLEAFDLKPEDFEDKSVGLVH